MTAQSAPDFAGKCTALLAQLRAGKRHRDALQGAGLSWREFSTAITRDATLKRDYEAARAMQESRLSRSRDRELRENLVQLVWKDIAVANDLLRKRGWLGAEEDFQLLPIERVAMLIEDGVRFRAEIDAARKRAERRLVSRTAMTGRRR